MTKLVAIGVVAAALLASCSSGGSSAASSPTCDHVKQVWVTYFTAAKQLNAAGASATDRQKAAFRAVRIATLADLAQISAAAGEDVNKGAGLIHKSLTASDQATAQDAMTQATVTIKDACGYTLSI